VVVVVMAVGDRSRIDGSVVEVVGVVVKVEIVVGIIDSNSSSN